MKQVIIDYSNNSITYVNDKIGFSQFGIAKEILNLIESEENEINNLEKRNKEIYDSFMATTQELTEYAEENERLKNLEYKFFDNSGDEESFTLEDYLELGNKVYDLQEENKRLKNELKSKTEFITELAKSIKQSPEILLKGKVVKNEFERVHYTMSQRLYVVWEFEDRVLESKGE